MNTPTPAYGFKSHFLSAGFLMLAFGLLAPSISRANVTVSVQKNSIEDDAVPASPSGSGSTAPSSGGGKGGGYGGGKGGGKGGGGGHTDSSSGSFTYTITLRNTLPTPVKGVTLEYHIYNRTTTLATGTDPQTTVDDVTQSSSVDLAGNEKKDIETSAIHFSTKNTNTPASQGKGGKGGSPASQSSTTTNVMGWVVYLKFNGKIVSTTTSDDNILQNVAKFLPKN